jgi:hypothetical protein
MVNRIKRIVLFPLYVPFVSPVKGYVCTCKMMGGAGAGSVDGINERGGSAGRQGGGGGVRLLINVESKVYDTDPTYIAPNKRVCRGYLVLAVTQQPGRPPSGGGHMERI